MTYESDPMRWTQSPGEAPESLRAVFDAGKREGPSDAQMRALALKLAALGGGAAMAASASAVHASTAGAGSVAATGAAAGGGALSLTKIAASLVLLGAAATGTILLRPSTPAPIEVHEDRQIEVAPPASEEPAIEPDLPTRSEGARVPRASVAPAKPARTQSKPAASTTASDPRAVDEVERDADPERGDEVVAKVPARAADTRSDEPTSRRAARVEERRATRRARSSAVAERTESTRRADHDRASDPAQASEIELLRRARAALAGRPREAFRLTEQHRSEYPEGVFTQERDVLAIEALLRSGELQLARELAEAFVRRYPSSPHAHRFRESMNLQ